MRILRLLVSAALIAGGSGSLLATSISVNFSSDREDAALAPGDAAGAPGYITTNWNNFDGIPADVPAPPTTDNTSGIDSPNAGVLTLGDGSTSGATISWSSVNAWNTTNGVTNPDNRLMNGYIDNNADFPLLTIDFANIPAGFQATGYDVVAYFGSDGNDRTGTIGITGGETFSFNTHSAQGGFPGAYLQTTDTGAGNKDANFAVWEGLNLDAFTITLTRGSNNSGVHGVQIIPVPEPAANAALLGLGALGLIALRRRRARG